MCCGLTLSVQCSYVVHGGRKVCKYRTTQNLEQMKQSLCLIQRENLMKKRKRDFQCIKVSDLIPTAFYQTFVLYFVLQSILRKRIYR